MKGSVSIWYAFFASHTVVCMQIDSFPTTPSYVREEHNGKATFSRKRSVGVHCPPGRWEKTESLKYSCVCTFRNPNSGLKIKYNPSLVLSRG